MEKVGRWFLLVIFFCIIAGMGFAVNGQDHGDEQSVIEEFNSFFTIEKQGNSRVTQALKKMGKL